MTTCAHCENNDTLPCPFCGCYSASHRERPSLFEGETCYFILCKQCEACGPEGDTPTEACILWSKRGGYTETE